MSTTSESSGTTDAESTACNECFRGTTETQAGHVLVKENAGDKCLKHLAPVEEQFLLPLPGSGSRMSTQPDVNVPSANGYNMKVDGSLVLDADGSPILAPAPAFGKLWVSAVSGQGENLLYVIQAPDSSSPLLLQAINGEFILSELAAEQLGSGALPNPVTTGRMLMVDKVPDCDGSGWVVREWCPDLPEDECANLTVTKDSDGYAQIGSVTPSATAGFLRTNPDSPCAPVSGDVLSDDEVTQFVTFLNQIFCDDDLPTVDSVTIERIIACGTKTSGEVVTTGAQPFTLAELFTALEELRQSDPSVSTDPVDDSGDPLVDGERYDAIYDSTTKLFSYSLSYREKKESYSQIAEFSRSNIAASEFQIFSVNLTTLGINPTADGFNYANLLFQIDVKGRGNDSSDELYGYVEIDGTIRAWAGVRNLGQTSLATAINDNWGESMIVLDVPITSEVVTFKLGAIYNHNDARNEILLRANLMGLKRIPV